MFFFQTEMHIFLLRWTQCWCEWLMQRIQECIKGIYLLGLRKGKIQHNSPQGKYRGNMQSLEDHEINPNRKIQRNKVKSKQVWNFS